MTTPLTKVITVIEARTSEGPMFCVGAKTKVGREYLASLFGKAEPGGYHILTPTAALALRNRLRAEAAA